MQPPQVTALSWTSQQRSDRPAPPDGRGGRSPESSASPATRSTRSSTGPPTSPRQPPTAMPSPAHRPADASPDEAPEPPANNRPVSHFNGHPVDPREGNHLRRRYRRDL